MAKPENSLRAVYASTLIALLSGTRVLHATDLQEEVKWLREQNEKLQQAMKEQQNVIDTLTRKVDDIQAKGISAEPPTKEASFGLNKVMISGEGGVGYFKTQADGRFPNGEFRVDEAKLFVESPVYENVYFFSEINLQTRESFDLTVQLGECYLDFENISRLWDKDEMLNLRLGRFYIPFGEEYIYRYAIDNPLISHSLTDLWGVDEGVELYGRIGKFSYAVAVQNGGDNNANDYTEDKSVAGRLSYDPTKWLHLSASAMRTGDLAQQDLWSDLYIANGWFVPLGGTNTTRFYANLVEGDVQIRLPHAWVRAFGGWARYDDNDPVPNNRRDLYYYSVEGVYDFTKKLYAAGRFSEILAPNGYPLVGNGNMGEYLFGVQTTELWRLSLGLGYRFSQNLILKAEYSFERGRELNGEKRDHEDLFGFQAAFKF